MEGKASLRPHAAVSFSALLGLAVRLVTIVTLHGTPFTRVMVGDSLGYLETARRIAGGELGQLGVFFQSAPLYPFLLVVLSSDWLRAATFQALVGSLACAAVAATAATVFPGERAAPWIAGSGAAVYGPLIFHDAELLPTSLAAGFVAFGLLAVLRASRPAAVFGSGLLLGFAALLAPGSLLVVLTVLGWQCARVPRERRLWIRPASLLAGVLAAIAPVTAHNLAAGDRVLISSGAGVNLFIGNNPEATGAFFLPPASGLDGTRLEETARAVAEKATGRSLKPSEVSSYWTARVRSWAASRPVEWLRLLGRKTLLAVNHYEIPNHLNYQFVVSRFAPGLRYSLPFRVLFPLSLLGGVLAVAGRRRRREGLLIVGALVACMAVPVLFFVTARYRLPAAPAMLVLAGGGLSWLLQKAGRRQWIPLLSGAALVVVLAMVARLHLVSEGDYAFDHLLLGDAQRKLGRLDEAVIQFKLAEETGPPSLRASLWLAQALVERGNREAAREAVERYLKRDPQDGPARAFLATLSGAGTGDEPGLPLTDYEVGTDLLIWGRDLEGASRALERAVERDPTHARAMAQLGRVRIEQARLDEAFGVLERAVRIAPTEPTVWENLARVYLAAGNVAAARDAADRALALAPDDVRIRQLRAKIR